MEKIKKIVCRYFYIFMIPLFCFSGGTAYASGQTVPDLSAYGSISVTMQEEENSDPVPGGTLTIYQAAELQEEDGKLYWKYTSDFEGCGLVPDGISEEAFAKTLEDYVESQNIQGIKKEISSEGTLSFDDLPLGIYLIVQEDPAEGYYPVNSFAVSVPAQEENGWNYHIDASPKMEQYTVIPPDEQETPPQPKETKDTSPGSDSLYGSPRTGQENRLILAASMLCGAALAGACILAVRRRREKHTD